MSYSPGQVPLGGIVAIATLTNAFPVPASGTVRNGWMYCDGSAIPAGNTLTGNTPDLNGSVFLRGSTTYGGTGGGTATLLAANIPSLTSTGTTTTTGTTVANTTGAGTSHSHGAGSYSATGGAHSNHAIYGRQANYFQAGANRNGLTTDDPGGPGSTNIEPALGDGSHTHTITGTSASESAHTHTIPSITVNSGQGVSVTYTNTASAFNIIPNYFDVIYLIRVK